MPTILSADISIKLIPLSEENVKEEIFPSNKVGLSLKLEKIKELQFSKIKQLDKLNKDFTEISIH